jgi:predicted cobalt transporter CbtA
MGLVGKKLGLIVQGQKFVVTTLSIVWYSTPIMVGVPKPNRSNTLDQKDLATPKH